MFRSLSPGAIGASVENLADGLDLAARHGFAGYHFNIGEVATIQIIMPKSELIDLGIFV